MAKHNDGRVAELNKIIADLRRNGASEYPPPQQIKMASGAACAAERFCFPVGARLTAKEVWMDRHDLFVTDGRAFALVTTHDRVFYMDCITGSLYSLGECLSGSGRADFRRNRAVAESILLTAGQDDIAYKGDSDEQV